MTASPGAAGGLLRLELLVDPGAGAPVEAEFRGGRERGGDMLTKLSKDGRAYRLGGRES